MSVFWITAIAIASNGQSPRVERPPPLRQGAGCMLWRGVSSGNDPSVQVELELSARVVDLVSEGFDLALRVARTRPKSSSLVARKVGEIVLQLYASPTYLARRAVPR